ncbi:MAG: nicotinate (nicotinamide) nucleotide adenylyltransferase [Acidobacteria bacterium]|nr:MAG: nicotinate (nicotinamide) nucleotide adenylyltransferase [Acidobacteriota bacterium]
MNIGICGGTFDPFHRGHVDTVAAACDVMNWDRILYIPAYRQPFKTDREHAEGPHRFAMAILGTLEREEMYVLPIELERGAISYTVDTLEALRTVYQYDTLDWIIGDDNLAQLDQWKSIDRIFELANFCVLTRRVGQAFQPVPQTGSLESLPQTRPTHGAIVFAKNPVVPISSTEIRRRVAVGESIEDLVDPRVARYIHHYGLYRKEQA